MPGFLVVWGSRWLMRADPARIASAAVRARPWRLGRWRLPLGLLVAATVGNLFALPIHGLAWRAGRVGGSVMLGTPPHWSLSGLAGTLQANRPSTPEKPALVEPRRDSRDPPGLAIGVGDPAARPLAVGGCRFGRPGPDDPRPPGRNSPDARLSRPARDLRYSRHICARLHSTDASLRSFGALARS